VTASLARLNKRLREIEQKGGRERLEILFQPEGLSPADCERWHANEVMPREQQGIRVLVVCFVAPGPEPGSPVVH